MDVDCDDVRIERPHRSTPLDHNYWPPSSSCPSLSLQLRNSRGGEGKHLKSTGSIKQDIRGGAISGRSVLEGYSTCLPRNRQSAPIISGYQGASHRSSHPGRNEEWDTSPLNLIRDASRMFDSLFDRGPKPLCMKDDHGVLAKAKRKVSFARTAPESIPPGSSLDDGCPITSLWYDHAALDQFAHDADARASIVRRSMNYASKNERTYNAAIGLTSPETLHLYLSSPEEIFGIEHLLAGQDEARTSLRTHQRKVLREEQRRQSSEGQDPHLLAEKLGDISSIAAHMALERATYLCLIG